MGRRSCTVLYLSVRSVCSVVSFKALFPHWFSDSIWLLKSPTVRGEGCLFLPSVLLIFAVYLGDLMLGPYIFTVVVSS